LKGLHKSLCNAARAAAAAAASAATANLKRQDKCDNLSAFWTAGTPATWHKINVKQNGGTAKQQERQGQGHGQKGSRRGPKVPVRRLCISVSQKLLQNDVGRAGSA